MASFPLRLLAGCGVVSVYDWTVDDIRHTSYVSEHCWPPRPVGRSLRGGEMRRRSLWSAVLVAGLTVAGCGSATGSDQSSGGSTDKLVVWDWKSGEPSAASYIEKVG